MGIRTIIISLLLSVFLFCFLIWPKYQNLSLLRAEISQKMLELQSLQEYFGELKGLLEQLKEDQDSLSKIDSALPFNPSLSELFNFIQEASSQSGLFLKQVSLVKVSGEKEIKGEIKESKVDLTLSGDYSSLKNFISILEKSARIIEIERISFVSPKKEKENFDFYLTINVYSY